MIIMFFYGIYILIKGKVGAGDGNGGELIGKHARIVGAMYLATPITAIIGLLTFQLFLVSQGKNIENYGSFFLTLIAFILVIFLFIITKFSKRMHANQINQNP